jgi:hypothetical protein
LEKKYIRCIGVNTSRLILQKSIGKRTLAKI